LQEARQALNDERLKRVSISGQLEQAKRDLMQERAQHERRKVEQPRIDAANGSLTRARATLGANASETAADAARRIIDRLTESEKRERDAVDRLRKSFAKHNSLISAVIEVFGHPFDRTDPAGEVLRKGKDVREGFERMRQSFVNARALADEMADVIRDARFTGRSGYCSVCQSTHGNYIESCPLDRVLRKHEEMSA
jgi:hypothetical protein